MAVTAYASAVAFGPNPPYTVADATYAQGALPVATVQLYGIGVDDQDVTPNFTYSWQIIENPPGSTAKFQNTGNSASTLQNPVLVDVNIWENIRIFLVVTNLDTNTVSEADIYKAPDTAFVTVRITSASAGIQKPAPSERNWFTPLRAIIQKIEDLAIAGVNANLPAAVLQLIGGGYAILNNATLHKHTGSHVDKATEALPGVIYLTDPPAFPNDPKALNSERLTYTANLGGTITNQGFSPGTVEPPVILVGTKRPHVLFYLKEAQTITGFRVFLADGGAAAGTYEFGLYYETKANWEAGAGAIVGTTVTGSAAADNAPLILVKDLNVDMVADRYIGLCCLQAPNPAGGSATVTVTTKRSV